MNEATERGINQNLEFKKRKFKTIMEEADTIKNWWMFQDEFFVEDEDLNSDDLKAFALKGARKNKKV